MAKANADIDDDEAVIEERSASAATLRQREVIDEADRNREAHQRALADLASKERAELTRALKGMPEPEQRVVRMHAYLQVLGTNNYTPNNLQQAVDLATLRLVRYMTEGKV